MLLATSRTLQDFLLSRIPEGGADWIDIHSLHQDAGSNPLPVNRLVLCLYSVVPDPHLRNRPKVHTDRGFVRPPMAVLLRYLVTYNSDDHPEAQERTARVLEAFHTRPILGPPDLDPELSGLVRELSVRILSPSIEEMNQLWTALNRPLRLSLYLEVTPAFVPNLEAEGDGPVQERELRLETAR